jgi:transposase
MPNCGVRQVNVPWAREKSAFTLLMEALLFLFAQTMQISQIAKKFRLRDKRVWTVISHYVAEAMKNADFSDITSIGVDETSRKKGALPHFMWVGLKTTCHIAEIS